MPRTFASGSVARGRPRGRFSSMRTVYVSQKRLAIGGLMSNNKYMNTTAAQVLAYATITAETTFGIDRSTAFDVALATMIAEDPETMRAFLSAAQAQDRKSTRLNPSH